LIQKGGTNVKKAKEVTLNGEKRRRFKIENKVKKEHES
jgi:hypothetical protein